MAGHSRSQNGVASLAYVPAISIHGHGIARLNGITGTSPVMTNERQCASPVMTLSIWRRFRRHSGSGVMAGHVPVMTLRVRRVG
jgi:hypothetical protein